MSRVLLYFQYFSLHLTSIRTVHLMRHLVHSIGTFPIRCRSAEKLTLIGNGFNVQVHVTCFVFVRKLYRIGTERKFFLIYWEISSETCGIIIKPFKVSKYCTFDTCFGSCEITISISPFTDVKLIFQPQFTGYNFTFTEAYWFNKLYLLQYIDRDVFQLG